MKIISSVSTTTTTTTTLPDFKGLSAAQINTKASDMYLNEKTLTDLMRPVNYTGKLSALPELLPPDVYLTALQISYGFDFAQRFSQDKDFMSTEIVAVSPRASKGDEIEESNDFRIKLAEAPVMADLCKDKTVITPVTAGAHGGSAGKTDSGSKFAVRCNEAQGVKQ
jgi:hypothetical protein